MATIPETYDIPRCLQSLTSIDEDLRRLTSGLTECQFQAPPRAGGWSIAYCLEHLLLTGNGFLPAWDAALASRHSGDGPFPYTWLERRILRFAEPPYRLKIKTTQPFDPRGRRPMDETLRRFLKMHAEFTARISATRGLDASHIKVQSPFVSWIKYSLGFSFDVALAHERRHIWQAWQVRGQVVGPDGGCAE